jgi:uncharacterized RDD family membrane protein YckC
MSTIEAYVQQVIGRIAPGVPGRSRIEADLRTHLEERVAAGEPATEAVARMGDPADVARAYLEGVDLALAAPARRLGGFLFDMALGATMVLAVALVFAISSRHSPTGEFPSNWREIPVTISLVGAAFVLGILYFPVLETVFGQTVGKRVFGTAVAREGGEQIGFGQAVLRRLPLLFDFWPVDAAFLFFTKKRQRAFDIVARTVVIETWGGERAWAWTVLAWIPPALLMLAIQLVLH